MQYYYTGHAFTLSTALIQISVLFWMREQILNSFSVNDDARAVATDAWFLLLILTLVDSIQSQSIRFIKAAGKHFSALFYTLLSQCGGLQLGWYLCF
mmetsp:Transcript_1226/g.1615  ORF Transcript_1226/g.1615 Transcript_1226/m.1615 type:complete len:97 (+) Transcript_1226:59-349(+)